ncbi:MAG: hypothetical protein ACLRX5_04275 [Slackia sp.]
MYALAGRHRLRFMIGSSAQEARRIEDIRDAEKVIADNERLAAALSARQELLRSIKTACPDKESRFARGIASMAEDYDKLASGRAEAEGMRAALAASGSAESASIMESVLALKNEIESVRAESAQCQRSLGDADRRAKSAAARREQCEADLAKVEAANVALEEERLKSCLSGVRGQFVQGPRRALACQGFGKQGMLECARDVSPRAFVRCFVGADRRNGPRQRGVGSRMVRARDERHT